MQGESIKTETVALALGSNIGDRAAALRAAIAAIEPYVRITAVSPVYETAAAYVTNQPVFLNLAVIGETAIEPLPLLRVFKNLESELGRTPTYHYGPRLIDIDIVFYGSRIVEMPELLIPHPRLFEREFVLRPLCDIASDWKHPKTGLSVAEMLVQAPVSAPQCIGPLS